MTSMQVLCKHKYDDRNFMCKHDKVRGVFVFQNKCVKCGLEFSEEITDYALYIAAKSERAERND